MIKEIIGFFGTNEVVLGIVSIMGIVGFVLTIVVTLRTSSISRILKYNQVTDNYNESREAFLQSFEGHRKSIMEDNDKSAKILKTILAQVEAYRANFGEIISFKERRTLRLFIKELEKKPGEVDWNSICNYLAKLSGRLSKKEDRKNG